MAGYKGPEQRKNKRIYKKIPLNITQYNDRQTSPKLDEEICLNVSEGGVLIECSKRLPRGARLKLKIMLILGSKYRIISVPARIMWNKKSFRSTYYLGCKFTRLKQKGALALRRLK